MDHALCPDEGPARLLRFADLGGRGLLATYVEQDNLLIIDTYIYEMLSSTDRQRVITTRRSLGYEIDGGAHSLVKIVPRPTPTRSVAA